MQIEGLNFLKVQKSLRAKSMNQKKKKKKKKKKKSQMKIRVDFQTTKYLVLVWFWEQRWRIKYGCIEQYLEDKK